ncbi:glutaredoxin family protein [Marinicella sp. S1101]|uniref:MauE/DoxX family redox-associated membrane protein n=1 Tax=Marinicella marina TaxID=2996016 RepID=UPI002260A475|nr:MauE/DoxX family redox-associated membrane protein [Marinicella marina]MCX7553403.1 glutaredoxin family protein [Marinicella marina]MDJ1140026.1 glutaredoxin domain-containing protein [Marinicella marina]
MKKKATLYRMETSDHICPFGLKAKHLLKKHGYELDDQILESREQTDAFKEQHDVKTTPQVFIEGKRIGGYDDLVAYLGLQQQDKDETTYKPIIAIFSVTFLMSLALSINFYDSINYASVLMWFIGISMCVLAVQKLRDLEAFTNQFITYDLLAMKYIPYAKVYAFAEAYAGVGMLSGLNPMFYAPVSLFIGTVGAISVCKAVYVDKRDLKCACVGGDSNVPLGFVSLTENLMMIFAASYMLIKFL